LASSLTHVNFISETIIISEDQKLNFYMLLLFIPAAFEVTYALLLYLIQVAYWLRRFPQVPLVKPRIFDLVTKKELVDIKIKGHI
jgi:hypothetical protein